MNKTLYFLAFMAFLAPVLFTALIVLVLMDFSLQVIVAATILENMIVFGSWFKFLEGI